MPKGRLLSLLRQSLLYQLNKHAELNPQWELPEDKLNISLLSDWMADGMADAPSDQQDQKPQAEVTFIPLQPPSMHRPCVFSLHSLQDLGMHATLLC